MKFKTTVLLSFAIILTLATQLDGQRSSVKSVDLPFNESATFFTSNAEALGVSSKDQFIVQSEFEGFHGMRHIKYVQRHENIPVFGGGVTVHAKDGTVQSITGNLRSDFTARPNAAISERQASQWAKRVFSEKNPKKIARLDENEIATSNNLVWIDKAFPSFSDDMRLAYKVNLKNLDQQLNEDVFIDAQTGQEIYTSTNIMHKGVPGTGQTKYYGERSFTCDSVKPDLYRLFDETRGDGVRTLNGENQVWENQSTVWDFRNTEDEVAIDLHFGMTEFYDMMLSRFEWDGIDNKGGALVSVVSDEKFINAFWNGDFATFGRGDCNHGPLTTLEVIAHELMHGITDYTSDLIYDAESGAINESMSDVFGKALEYYVDPANFNWLIGQSFLLNKYGRSFRSMVDPNTRNHPKYYGGMFWNDWNGVHTNSSIGNHFFYQLVEGGAGTNEVGYSYDFEGLGMDKALQIVFLTQSAYLFASSDYQHYYETSILAAEEIFGAGSMEVETVKEAWTIVGLPTTRNINGKDLSLSYEFAESVTCLDEEYISFTVTVANVGSEDFFPMVETATILLEGNELMNVTDVIRSGEERTYTFNDEALIDFYGFRWFYGELEYSPDENMENNSDFQRIQNGNPDGIDLSIAEVFRGETFSCGAQKEFQIRFRNLSCTNTTGDQQAELVFTAAGGTELDRSVITIPAIEQGGDVVRTIEFDSKDFNGTIEATLIFAEDNILQNNSFLFQPTTTREINTSYSYDFENRRLPVEIASTITFNGDFYEHNGGYKFAVSGDNPFAFSEPCSTPEGAAESNPLGTLYMCADLTNMRSPVLEFNVTQFRNEDATDFPELEDLTAVLLVRMVNAGQVREEYVYGVTEGEEKLVSFNLDPQFSGSIEFHFAAQTGSDPTDPDYLEYDVIMVDDIVIENRTSVLGTDIQKVNIQPNPSADIFMIDSDQDVNSLKVVNLDGREVKTLFDVNNKRVDLSGQQSGLYVLEIIFENGDKGQALLIKQ